MTAESGETELESEGGGSRTVLQQWSRMAILDSGRIYRALFAAAVGFFLLITLFPFYWLVLLAVTPPSFAGELGLVPVGINLEVFVDVFTVVPFHWYMFNSVVVGLLTTIVVIFVGSIGGYVFGRLEFRGRRPLLLVVLIVSYFPQTAFLIPVFYLLTGNVSVFGISSPALYNTPGAIVLPLSALVMPLAIYILATFYGQIPDGLEDAARIEGSTRLGALWRVIMPISAPAVATVAILTFIVAYNEFFFSSLMTNGMPENWSPIVWGIQLYGGSLAAAASIVGIVPMAAIVLLAQRKIVSGLTQGGLRG